jgi:hypothetical protein
VTDVLARVSADFDRPDDEGAEVFGDHTLPLGDTEWRVWRPALLRATGFPADGVDRFRAVDAAQAAEAFLAGGDRAAFDEAYAAAEARLSAAAHTIAGEPLFREAVTWQNPAVIKTLLDPLRAAGPVGKHNSSRRQKETGIASYWSRYSAKNDSIGFFGPVCWVRITDDIDGVVATPGQALVRSRRAALERWALVAYADHLATDAQIRRWLPVKLVSTVSVDGRALKHPRGDVQLSRAEAALVTYCDGRAAQEAARAVAADPGAGVRRPEDAYLLIDSLVQRELLVWGIDLPINATAEAVLRHQIEAIADPTARERAWAGYAELSAACDAVTAVAGDAAALHNALDQLGRTFTRLTSQDADRAAGQMYAGRTVCFEDTVRDIDVAVGRNVIDVLAPALDLLCTAARWLSAEIARAYAGELSGVYDELADGGGPVPFAELSFLAQGLLFGAGPRPADDVSVDFTRRWAELLGLDTEAREVKLRSADLAGPVAAAFDAARPAWAHARYHSPDVHLVGTSEQLRSGEFTSVLGELHAAWNALDSELFVVRYPDPLTLLEYQSREVPPRVIPLYPNAWPRLTARTCSGLSHPDDLQLGFVPAPGSDRRRLLPVTSLTVARDDTGELTVNARDGRSWPLGEVFGDFLATHTVDAFKLLGAYRHSPRVWIDAMVVARETWRRSAGELTWATTKDERERYLQVRAWRAELDLPERVFVKVATEVKPIYVDLTSSVYIRVLTMAIRAGLRRGRDTAVTISEMMPTPDQAWVPDRAGNRYASELRLLVVDPRRSAWAESGGHG